MIICPGTSSSFEPASCRVTKEIHHLPENESIHLSGTVTVFDLGKKTGKAKHNGISPKATSCRSKECAMKFLHH
jgi:hypothetical protein